MSKILSNLPDGVSQRMVSEFFDYEEEKIEVVIGLMNYVENIDASYLFDEDGTVKIQDAGDINDMCLEYLEELDDEQYKMAFSFLESHFDDFHQILMDKI